jgi:hypothetical protein
MQGKEVDAGGGGGYETLSRPAPPYLRENERGGRVGGWVGWGGVALLGHWNTHEAHFPHALHRFFGKRVVAVDGGGFGREVRVGESGGGVFDALLHFGEAICGRQALREGEGVRARGAAQVPNNRQHFLKQV